MQASEYLLAQFKEIFCRNSWRSPLCKRTELQKDAALFVQKLLSAAANFDLSLCSPPSLDTHLEASELTGSTACDYFTNVVACFANKSSPPSPSAIWKSCRYQIFPISNASQKKPHAISFHSILPPDLLNTEQRKWLCFCCESSSHLLRECPQRAAFNRRLQEYEHLGKAATYLINHNSSDFSENDRKVSQFFEETEIALQGPKYIWRKCIRRRTCSRYVAYEILSH